MDEDNHLRATPLTCYGVVHHAGDAASEAPAGFVVQASGVTNTGRPEAPFGCEGLPGGDVASGQR
jgi:hypothetical protein